MEPENAVLPKVVSMVPPPAATTTGRLELKGTEGWNMPPLNCKAAPPVPVAPKAVSLATERMPWLIDVPPCWVLVPVRVHVPAPILTIHDEPAARDGPGERAGVGVAHGQCAAA